MELTPHGNSAKVSELSAECRCPPGTAQSIDSPLASPCYKIFEQGPCDGGQFFAPVTDSTDKKTIMFVSAIQQFQFSGHLVDDAFPFQTKEAARCVQDTDAVHEWYGALATRLKMLHVVHEGAVHKGKAHRSGQA